jgi:hypothetical protein
MKRIVHLQCGLTVLSILLLIGSCKKTDITSESTISALDPAVVEAKGYFESNVQKENSGSIQVESYNNSNSSKKTPIWNKAYVTTLSTGPAVVIPLKYTKKSLFKSNLDSTHVYDMDVSSKLVIYKDHSGQYHVEVVNMYPDSVQAKNSGYSGIIKVEDWGGNFRNEYKYEGNKIKKLINDVSAGKTSTNSVNPHSSVTVNTMMAVQTDYYMVTFTYVEGDMADGVYSYEYLGSSYSFYDDGGGGGGGSAIGGSDYGSIGGGGGGPSSKVSALNSLTVETGNDPITNVKDYIKCFNGSLNATYTVTLCVAQPILGERDSYSSAMSGVNVGHTFLTFQQNEGGVVTTRSMGFYPNGIVTPGEPRAFGSLNNDQGHIYNVSLTYTTTGTQFMNILNSFSNGNTVNYDLNTNNCTTWALSALSAGGINVNTTPGSWPFGGGDDPGDLGEDIRNMPVGSNTQKNVSSTDAPANTGTCP